RCVPSTLLILVQARQCPARAAHSHPDIPTATFRITARPQMPRTARVRSGQDLTTGDRDVRSHHRRALGSGGDLQASNVRRVADRLGSSRWTASRWVMERSGRMLADPPFGTPARCEPCSATAAQIRWYCGWRSVWWLTAPSAPQAGAAHRRSCSAVGLLVLAGWAFLVAGKWLELRAVAVEDPSSTCTSFARCRRRWC